MLPLRNILLSLRLIKFRQLSSKWFITCGYLWVTQYWSEHHRKSNSLADSTFNYTAPRSHCRLCCPLWKDFFKSFLTAEWAFIKKNYLKELSSDIFYGEIWLEWKYVNKFLEIYSTRLVRYWVPQKISRTSVLGRLRDYLRLLMKGAVANVKSLFTISSSKRTAPTLHEFHQ